MSFKTEQIDNMIIRTLNADFDPATELAASGEELMAALNQAEQPVFLIIDMLDVQFSIEQMILAANSGKQRNLFQHPNNRELIFVTRDDMLALSAKGLDSSAFGHVKAKVFTSLDKAVAYAHSQKDII